jgi:hypothetical protein
MSSEDGGRLTAPDPDVAPARTTRNGAGRGTRQDEAAPAAVPPPRTDATPRELAEATLNLEPLRVPIAAMVQGSLAAEREALERMGADLRAELARLRGWQAREEAMRTDQTALYRHAAEHWQAAGDHAHALCAAVVRLEGITQVLQAAVEAAIARFWRRAMAAAGLVALVGLGLIAGLCGVVWLAITQR